MKEFILNAIMWTLALYGLIEIIKVCVYTYKAKKLQRYDQEIEEKEE